jgi:hypothetical protein
MTGHDGLSIASSALGLVEDPMTRQELDLALARLGLDVPEKERDEIADMAARLRPPGGRDVAAEPAHVVKFPEA